MCLKFHVNFILTHSFFFRECLLCTIPKAHFRASDFKIYFISDMISQILSNLR